MRKNPIFYFLLPCLFSLFIAFVAAQGVARPPDRSDLISPSPAFPRIPLIPDDDDSDSGVIMIDPDVARHLRPNIHPALAEYLRRHPFFPHIDDDPPLPIESPEASEAPEASEDPVPSDIPSDDDDGVIPPITGGNPSGSPATGNSGPTPTGSIPTVQIPAAGGCSLHRSTESTL